MTTKDRLFLVGGGLLFLAVLVWLIRDESDRFRESTKEVVREEGAEIVAEGAGQIIEKMGDEAGELVGTTVEGVGDLLERAEDTAGDLVGDSDRTADEANRENDNKKPEEVSTPPRAVSPGGVFKDVFGLGTDLAESVDRVGQQLLGLSIKEEIDIGEQVHDAIVKEYKMLSSPDIVHRLQLLAAPLIEIRDRKEIPFNFYVIEDQEVNAFSHLGGHIYINTGLLNLTETDAELQFVLAHEIAHVDLKHCVEKLTYSSRVGEVAGDLAGSLAQVAYQAVALGYSESQEFDADAWAFRALKQIGRSREEAMAFPLRMVAHEQKQGGTQASEAGSGLPDVVAKEIETHFQSHPPAAERIGKLEGLDR